MSKTTKQVICDSKVKVIASAFLCHKNALLDRNTNL